MPASLRTWLPIAVFSVLWLDLIRLLSTQWEAREQYAYGWFVPFFAAALLWRRWLDRPGGKDESRKQKAEIFKDHSPLTSGFSFQLSAFPISAFALPAFCFLLFLLLPLRVIYEINPDWPLISWLYTLIAVVATLYAFFLAGGWPWVKHFAFPVAFILVAVVWPYRIEKGLTQGLMRVVASLTVELLGWLDIPALQRGNLIELSTGTVGIDEACSGIRSFQSSLMAALLMGELYRFRLWPRAALVAIAITLGFCFNVVRTLLLSYQANQQGLGAIEKWHDPAGLTITVACFFCLWAIAVIVKRRTTGLPDHGTTGLQDHGPQTTDHGPRATGLPDQRAPGPSHSQPSTLNSQPSSSSQLSVVSVQPADSQLSTLNSQPSQPPSGSSGSQLSTLNSQLSTSIDLRPPTSDPSLQPSAFSLQPSLPRRYLLAVGCWVLVSIASTEAWYRSHAPKDSGVFHWSVALPETKPTFQKVELAPRTVKMLAFDLGVTGKWQEGDGSEWNVSFFRWNPRSVESVIHARLHRPEICLPASGFRQVSESRLVWFEAGGLKLPFRKYVYESEGRRLYVFFCQWEDGAEKNVGMQASKQADRLQSVLKGRRLVGQQTLEIILTGCESLEHAEQEVRNGLPQLIRADGPDKRSPGKV